LQSYTFFILYEHLFATQLLDCKSRRTDKGGWYNPSTNKFGGTAGETHIPTLSDFEIPKITIE
jgi:hypothetical protein